MLAMMMVEKMADKTVDKMDGMMVEKMADKTVDKMDM